MNAKIIQAWRIVITSGNIADVNVEMCPNAILASLFVREGDCKGDIAHGFLAEQSS